MVFVDIVFDCSLVSFVFNFLAVSFSDRRTVAVGTGNKNDIILAYSVSKKTRIHVSVDKHASHMAKVQSLVAIRHTASHNCTFRKFRTFHLIYPS